MRIEKIANRQLFFILFMMRSTVIISFLPVLTTADALQDAWLSAILSFFGAALLVSAIGGLGLRFPNMTIIEYSQKLIGKWAGKAVCLVLLWAFLTIVATDTRIYCEAIITGFLSETPLPFVIYIMVITGAIAAYSGIEVVARAADLLFPVFLIMLILSLAFAIPDFLTFKRNLEPVFARGLGPVLRGSIVPTVIIAQYLVLTMLIPAVDQPEKSLNTTLWALAGASLVLVLSTLIVTALLGPKHGAKMVFPFFSMVTTLNISEFLERIETFTMFAWGFGVFINISVFMYCGSKGLAQVLELEDHRPLIGPLAVIWGVFSIHSYKDMFQLISFFQPKVVGPFVLIWLIMTIGILWIAYGIRRLRDRRKI